MFGIYCKYSTLANCVPMVSGESDLHSLLGNMSQQQLMQFLGGMGMGGGMGGLGGLSSLVSGPRPGSAQSESAS